MNKMKLNDVLVCDTPVTNCQGKSLYIGFDSVMLRTSANERRLRYTGVTTWLVGFCKQNCRANVFHICDALL